MDERRHQREQPEPATAAVAELVEAQLEAARAHVFAAYVRARDQARALVEEDAARAERERRAS